MRRFAEDTSVSTSKTRGEIDSLLRTWGCHGLRWTDDYRGGQVILEFTWEYENIEYLARFNVSMPRDAEVREEALDGRSNKFSENKYQKLLEARGRREHRVLLLWLKAALNAVDAGIVDAATLFLPFLVGNNGDTFAEIAVPKLPQLISNNASALLCLPAE